MSVIEVLLDPVAHLIIGNGNEAANVARIIAHYSTVNFKNIHLMRFLCATFFECYRMRPRRTIRIIVKNSNKTAVTNARFASLQGCRSALSPSRPRPFRFANRALVTSGICDVPLDAAGFRLRLGDGRCAPAAFR